MICVESGMSIETAFGRHQIQLVADWIKGNLGELQKTRGRWKPIMPQGY